MSPRRASSRSPSITAGLVAMPGSGCASKFMRMPRNLGSFCHSSSLWPRPGSSRSARRISPPTKSNSAAKSMMVWLSTSVSPASTITQRVTPTGREAAWCSTGV